MIVDKWKKEVEKSRAALRRGDKKQAIKMLENALKMAERAGDIELRLETLSLLAGASMYLKEWKPAEEYQARAVDIARRGCGIESREHGRTLCQLAHVYFRNKDLDLAEKYALTAAQVLSNIEFDTRCFDCNTLAMTPYGILARVCFRRGDQDAARKWVLKIRSVIGADEIISDNDLNLIENRLFREHKGSINAVASPACGVQDFAG